MDILLEKNLPHQKEAVEGILNAIGNVSLAPSASFHANPAFPDGYDISENVRKVQERYDFPYELRESPKNGKSTEEKSFFNLDVKMETGTGKTYVYTNAIYELNRRYGFNKFVIVVPSLSIKSNTVNFLSDSYVKRHFSNECGYNKEIMLYVAQRKASGRKGRDDFPEPIRKFYQSSAKSDRQIHILVMNQQLLTNKSLNSEYDSGPDGIYRPIDALKATNPVVILDEPHRFKRAKTYYKQIEEKLEPELMIRFGATFPENGKTESGKDYENLVYDLNAREAFERGLIKSIAKEHFGGKGQNSKSIRLKKAVKNEYAIFDLLQEGKPAKQVTVYQKESMGMVDESMSGIRADEIQAKKVKFNNAVELNVGETMTADVYMKSYQENMIDLALRRHFETERRLFNRKRKIKPLALFFIEDIDSYRGDESGEKYLADLFDKILEKRLEEEIKEVEGIQAKNGTDYSEYIAYLKASLKDIPATRAGYFARDLKSKEEAIAEEIDIILKRKKELLSIKDKDGKFNTLRFLFSKWTLREGWDQPNIFTICKLRSSGSEISKLQEVGRGLRLPVNELGNRVTDEEFTLNYIVDYTEADFAKKLVDEVNGQLFLPARLSRSVLKKIAEETGTDELKLYKSFVDKSYIDEDRNIIPKNREAFCKEYPIINIPFKSGGKIRERNGTDEKRIKIRSGIYEELRELWERINQRFILYYSEDVDAIIEQVPLKILKENKIFGSESEKTRRETLDSSGNWATVVSEGGLEAGYARELPYNEFLKRINRITSLPITTVHNAIVEYVRENPEPWPKFTQNAVAAFAEAFRKWEIENLKGHYFYRKSNSKTAKTALTDNNGNPKEDIAQFRIGVMSDKGSVSANYLYDTLVFDSDIEKENISKDLVLNGIDRIYVFGKIPNRSISIPTITNQNYSPDFMYVVKRTDGSKELNLVVETKGKEEADLGGIEKAKIDSARQFFNDLSEEGFKVHFQAQTTTKNVRDIIMEILEEETKE